MRFFNGRRPTRAAPVINARGQPPEYSHVMRPLPPILAGLVLAVMTGVHFLWPAATWIDWPWRYVGVAPIVLGFGLGAWGGYAFRRRKTNPFPGEGRASALVTDGPYRFTRNPMYLGLAVALFGAGLLMGGASALLGPPVFITLITPLWIVREERWLTDAFGDDYTAYRSRVRRWL